MSNAIAPILAMHESSSSGLSWPVVREPSQPIPCGYPARARRLSMTDLLKPPRPASPPRPVTMEWPTKHTRFWRRHTWLPKVHPLSLCESTASTFQKHVPVSSTDRMVELPVPLNCALIPDGVVPVKTL